MILQYETNILDIRNPSSEPRNFTAVQHNIIDTSVA